MNATNNITVEYLDVAKYTTNADVYDLYIKTENDERWLYINGDSGFLLNGKTERTIEDAIAEYLTPEFQEWYDYCERKAWGYYD